MSMLIAAFMFIALLALSVAHFLWSIGRTWPIRNEQLLAETVVGTAGVTRMPSRWLSLLKAVFFIAAGIAALSLADHDGGGAPLTLPGLPLAAVFLARGAAGYTANWQKNRPHPNFRLNDKRVYSPLSLFLGIGFAVLVLMRLL